MPNPKRPARLWLRPTKSGPGRYIILFEGRQHATGCLEGDVGGANDALQDFLRRLPKARPVGRRHPQEVTIAEALTAYLEHRTSAHADGTVLEKRPAEFMKRISDLNEFWGGMRVSEITGGTCRAYAKGRPRSSARRHLEDLRAALRFYGKEGYLEFAPEVVLPAKSQPRTRWLTREEAARLLWAAYRSKEAKPWHRQARNLQQQGLDHRQIAERLRTPPMTVYSALHDPRDPASKTRHVARFILIALYTGTRSTAICEATWDQYDLQKAIFHRRPSSEDEIANKRRTPVRLPDRLCAHLKRWRRSGGPGPVHFNGEMVGRISKAFNACVERSGITHASPHSLRHTAATWLMQNGTSLADAGAYLGMTEETLSTHYYHHHPDYNLAASQNIVMKPTVARKRRPANAA